MKKLQVLKGKMVLNAERRLIDAFEAIEDGEPKVVLWRRSGQLLGEVQPNHRDYSLNISGVKRGRAYDVMLLAAIGDVASDDIRGVITGSAFVLGRSCTD